MLDGLLHHIDALRALRTIRMSISITPRQLLTALLVVTVWGVNFVIIKIGLRGVPPFLLGALRFILVAFPAIFFLPRPKVDFKWMLAYALTISFAQFAFLFLALAVGMPAGLASLTLQSQALFTVSLSAWIFGDRLHATNLLGMALAATGLILLGTASLSGSGAHVPLAGLGLTLCAALSWASGNVISKKIGKTALLSLVAWSALIPIVPFLLLSLYFEGQEAMVNSLTHLTLSSVACVAYLAIGATLIGYTLWGRLLASMPTQLVAPMTLMVPVIGIITAWLVLGEALKPMQAAGAAVVMAGLLTNVFGRSMLARIRRAPAQQV